MFYKLTTLLLVFLFLSVTPACAVQLEDLEEDKQVIDGWMEGSSWYKVWHMGDLITACNNMQATIDSVSSLGDVESENYQIDDINAMKERLIQKYQTGVEITENKPVVGDLVQLKGMDNASDTGDKYSLNYMVLKEIHQLEGSDERYVLYDGDRCVYLTHDEFQKYYTGLNIHSTLDSDNLIHNIKDVQKDSLNQYIRETSERLASWSEWNSYGSWLMGGSIGSGFFLGGTLFQLSQSVGTYIIVLSVIAFVLGLVVYGVTWLICHILEKRLAKLQKIQENHTTHQGGVI